MATLSLRFKQTMVNVYKLDEAETTTIGRSMENNIVIDNVAVSGRHAQITADAFGFMLKDLGSTNGTFMDGKPIKTRRLKDGDIILIGKHELVFTAEAPETDIKMNSQAHAPSLATSENHTVFLRTGSHEEMLRKDSARGRKAPLLTIKFKDKVLYKHLLKNRQTEIGRNPKSEIVIDNPAVSSSHAMLLWEENEFTIQDLGSKNGTYVNQKPVTKCRLQSGDIITIGRHELVFEETGSYTLAETARSYAEDALSISTSDHTMFLRTKTQQEFPGRNESLQTACLSFIAGGAGAIPIRKQKIIFGKGSEADVIVKGLFVAQTAALLISKNDGYYLQHVRGFIKPFVNGRKIIKTVKLNPADIIKIGGVVLQFNM